MFLNKVGNILFRDFIMLNPSNDLQMNIMHICCVLRIGSGKLFKSYIMLNPSTDLEMTIMHICFFFQNLQWEFLCQSLTTPRKAASVYRY